MGVIKSYPVFEADQVLSADHLNNLFQYVEQENRLTRTQLIGIGIVCGLETSFNAASASITLTKGVGVTSLGYLIRFPEDTGKTKEAQSITYTHYRSYTLPEGAKVKQASYTSWNMLELVENTVAEAEDKALTELTSIDNYAVVLFLEFNELDLKNCTTNDCNDKGKKVELALKPLLVLKTDLEEFSSLNLEAGKENLPDLVLKRFNVPFNRLKTPTEVLNAFHFITDKQTIKSIAEAYNKIYTVFQPVVGIANPFAGMEAQLLTILADVKSGDVLYSQYFYDFLDDLVKAYTELRELRERMLSACCPDEDLFPYHLMLGEAAKNSADGISAYRQYFIYSPLFGVQQQETKAILFLFKRMKKLLDTFKLPIAEESVKLPIRITPSSLGTEPLSKRAIPFYYDVAADLYSLWNADKTKYRKERSNLSYHAPAYASDDHVLNPLKYELEPYNFFRIEGHIGKPYKEAVTEVLRQRSNFSLPFDVVALNTRRGSATTDNATAHCYFQDLESLYNVLLSELLCKLHYPVCLLAKIPFLQLSIFTRTTTSLFTATETNTETGKLKIDAKLFSEIFKGGLSEFLTAATATGGKSIANPGTKAIAIRQEQNFIDARRNTAYTKGIFVREFCKPKDKTVGAEYLRLMELNQAPLQLPPVNLPSRNNNLALLLQVMYGHFLYFTDTIEELLKVLLPYDLADLDLENFERKYNSFIKEATDLGNLLVTMSSRLEELFGKNSVSRGYLDDMESAFMSFIISEMQQLRHLCLNQQIRRLKEEYSKRVSKLQVEKWFSLYSALHPGIAHKAGVPRGGTFILLYEEKPRLRDLLTNVLTELDEHVITRENINRNKAIFSAGAAVKHEAYNQLLHGEETDEAALRVKRARACINEFLEQGKGTLRAEELLELQQALTVLDTKETEVDFYEVKEQVVFADFYLPYLCCSDCAPISYIIQETKPDVVRPTVAIEPNQFCNNDESNYKIIASPAGGTVTGKGVNSSKFEFSPFGLDEGTHTITYKLNEQTTTTPVFVSAPKSADFEFKETELDNGSFIVELAAKEVSAAAYEWFIDQGLVPVNTSAKFIHQVAPFNGDSKVLVVKLRVSSGSCGTQEETKEISLQKTPREENQQKTICYAPKFELEQLPEGTRAEVLDAGGLQISEDLIVHELELDETNTFTVKYKLVDSNGNEVTKTLELIVLKPATSFVVEYKPSEDNDPNAGRIGNYIASAESSTAFNYSWNFRDIGSNETGNKSGNPVTFPRNNDINAGIELTLTVIEFVNNVRCIDQNMGKFSREELRKLFDGAKLRVINNKITDA